MALERPAVDEVGDRADRLEGELVQPHRMGQRQRVRREARVNEHVGVALVERGKQRLERRVAEIGAGDVAQQHHAVQRQLVVAALELAQRRVDVGQRQRCQARRTARGCAAHDLGDPVVGQPRQLAGVRRRRPGTRRAARPRRPRRRSRSAPSSACRPVQGGRRQRQAAQRRAVGGRVHVGVAVDPHAAARARRRPGRASGSGTGSTPATTVLVSVPMPCTESVTVSPACQWRVGVAAVAAAKLEQAARAAGARAEHVARVGSRSRARRRRSAPRSSRPCWPTCRRRARDR